MKIIVVLTMLILLSLSIYASEYIGLEDTSRTITIKNNSQFKAMIYYTNDDGNLSWLKLRPIRKCDLFSRYNSSVTLTFLINQKLYIWFPKINKELHPIIPENHTKFVINP